MEQVAGLALVLVLLVGALWVMVRGFPGSGSGGGRQWSSFSLRRAGTGFSMNGYLAVGTLATVSIVQGLLDLAPALGRPATPLIVVAIAAATIALAIAPAPTVVLLSLFGIAGQAITMTEADGPEATIAIIAIVAMAIWVSGLIRGFIARD